MSDKVSTLDERYAEFTELLSTCQAQLLASTYALVQNMADAEDICQRAALTLWQKYDEFEKGTNFRAWALTVARYHAMNFVRKRQADRHFFSEKALLAIADMQMEQAENAQLLESQWTRLADCIERLPQRHRRVVQLYYESTRTLAAVADCMNCTEGSIRTALCRIRQSLRECVRADLRKESAS